MINNLSTQLTSSISANCTQSSIALQEFNCTDNAIFEGKDKKEIIGNYFYKCTQKLENVVKAKQELQTFIDQHSSAKVKDVIVSILICIAVIMALFYLGPSLGKLLGSFSKTNNNSEGPSGTQEGIVGKSNLKNKIILLVLLIVIAVILYLVYF